MNGSEKEGSRRFSRRRRRDGESWQDRKNGEQSEKCRGGFYERPRWVPPEAPVEPIPVLECPWCGKPIKDISTAIQDKATGMAVHFDCVIERISGGETLESGDAVTYIGGGRFGIVHFTSPQETRGFTIKKILEWEDKEDRAGWRKIVGDHFSAT